MIINRKYETQNLLMKWSSGMSGTTSFIVLLHRQHVSTYIQVIFRPSFTDKSIIMDLPVKEGLKMTCI